MPEIDPQVTFRPNSATSDITGPLTALLDLAFGNVQGMIAQRSADIWKALPPGNLGDVLNSGGPGGDNFWAPSGAYAAPAFTAFGITGQASVIEVGTTIGGGNVTFTWSTSNSGNVQANSISIVDTTAGVTLASGLANTGSDVISIGSITNNAPASQIWTINGVNTHSQGFSRTFTVQWEWRVYVGTSTNVVLTANQIKALSVSNALQSSFPGTYPFNSGSSVYYYMAFPDSMGDVTLFFDPNGGFPWSMATASDNAAYSNVQSGGGGYSYDLVNVTNAHGVATNYRLYRSQFNFAGTPIFRVT